MCFVNPPPSPTTRHVPLFLSCTHKYGSHPHLIKTDIALEPHVPPVGCLPLHVVPLIGLHSELFFQGFLDYHLHHGLQLSMSHSNQVFLPHQSLVLMLSGRWWILGIDHRSWRLSAGGHPRYRKPRISSEIRKKSKIVYFFIFQILFGKFRRKNINFFYKHENRTIE